MNEQYRSQPGSLANTYSYNSTSGLPDMLMGMLKQYLQPNLDKPAPYNMTAFDFQRIMANTALRGQTNASYEGNNPLAYASIQRLVQPFGINAYSHLIGSDGSPTNLGKIAGDVFNRFMGPIGGVPHMGQFQNQIRDVMRGTYFGNTSYDMVGGGLNNKESAQVMNEIMRGTYSDELFTKKRGMYGSQDMMEIFRMGRDYNIFAGAKLGDLSDRTQQFSRVVSAGQVTFNTTNKEDALKNILDITGGDIALTDTAKVEETLRKVRTMSRNANVSMELLKELLTAGKTVSEQLGHSSGLGVDSMMSSLSNVQVMSDLGLLTSADLQKGGSQAGIAQRMNAITQVQLSNPEYANSIALVDTAKKFGVKVDPKLEQGLSRGLSFTAQEQNLLMQQLQDQFVKQGRDPGLINETIRLNTKKAVYEFNKNNPSAGQESKINELLTVMGFSTGINEDTRNTINKALDGQEITSKEANNIKDLFMMTAESQQIDEISAKSLFNRLTNRQKIQEKEKQQRVMDARNELKEMFLEKTRNTDSFSERFLRGFASGEAIGDAFTAAFLPQKDDLGYDPEKSFDEYYEEFGKNTRSRNLYNISSMILGRGAKTRKEALGVINTDLSNTSEFIFEDKLKEEMTRKAIADQIKTKGSVELGYVQGLLGKDASNEQALNFLSSVDPNQGERVREMIRRAQLLRETDFKEDELGSNRTSSEKKYLEEVLGMDLSNIDDLLVQTNANAAAKGNQEILERLNDYVNNQDGVQKSLAKEKYDNLVQKFQTEKNADMEKQSRDLKQLALISPNAFTPDLKTKDIDLDIDEKRLEYLKMSSYMYGSAYAVTDFFDLQNEGQVKEHVKALEKLIGTSNISDKDYKHDKNKETAYVTSLLKKKNLIEKIDLLKNPDNFIKEHTDRFGSDGFAMEALSRIQDELEAKKLSKGDELTKKVSQDLPEQLIKALEQLTGANGLVNQIVEILRSFLQGVPIKGTN